MINEGKNLHQFEALFNYATIGIVVTDEAAQIINFNTYAEEQFGYAKEEVLGLTVEVLLPEAYHARHVADRNEFFGDPHPRRMGEGRDLKARREDGSTFPVEVSLSYYRADGKTYVIAFVIDITVREKNEQTVVQQKEELERVSAEIRQLNVALEQKVEDRTMMLRETLAALEQSKEEVNEALAAERELGEMKSRFVTMASHEFRTPLSTILSSAYLLEKYNAGSEPEKREKHIKRIKTAVGDMQSILEDFLSLGKLDEGLIQASVAETPDNLIFATVQEVVQQLLPMCKPNQAIAEHCAGAGTVRIDTKLLKNILMNLLSNAIKFSPPNSVIQVDCTVADNCLTVRVADSGIGIAAEDMPRLFGRFFRAKNAGNIQGTGLGLHIVVKYLQLMDGTIDVISELNRGTQFTIRIPALTGEEV